MQRRKNVNDIRDRICDVLFDAYPNVLPVWAIWEKLIGEFPRLKVRQVRDYIERPIRGYSMSDFVEIVAPKRYRLRH